MVSSTLVIADHGPQFKGLVIKQAGRVLCVAPPSIRNDAAAQGVMVEVARQAGVDCLQCKRCLALETN